jgi:hypothetical protein
MKSADVWTFLSRIEITCTLGKKCSSVSTVHCPSGQHVLSTSIMIRADGRTNPAQSTCDFNGGENCVNVRSVHSPIGTSERAHDWFKCSAPDEPPNHRPLHGPLLLLSTMTMFWQVPTLMQIKAPLKSYGNEHWIVRASLLFNTSSLTECWRWCKSKLHWNPMAISIELYERHNWSHSTNAQTHEPLQPPETSRQQKMSWMQRRDYSATVRPMVNCV